MDIEQYFSELLTRPEPDLQRSEQTWDLRADEVSRFGVSDNDAALQGVLRRHDLAGEKVLDISFGAGRYLVEFARRGAQVSGVELSGRMLEHAGHKLRAAGLQAQTGRLLHSPWEDVVLQDEGWHDAFDLVFVHMSPVLSSLPGLYKALAACRKGLYVSSHVWREDSLLTDLQDTLGLPRRRIGSRTADDLYGLFNLLYQWGYFPALEFNEYCKTSHHSPDYILQRYASWLWPEEATIADRQRLLQLLQERTVGGEVETRSRDIIGHLYLDKRLRR